MWSTYRTPAGTHNPSRRRALFGPDPCAARSANHHPRRSAAHRGAAWISLPRPTRASSPQGRSPRRALGERAAISGLRGLRQPLRTCADHPPPATRDSENNTAGCFRPNRADNSRRILAELFALLPYLIYCCIRPGFSPRVSPGRGESALLPRRRGSGQRVRKSAGAAIGNRLPCV